MEALTIPLLTASSHADVPHLSGALHDKWFDRESFEYDRGRHTVEMAIGSVGRSPRASMRQLRRRQVLCNDHILEVANVYEAEIQDEAHTRLYNVNVVEYDAASRLLTIRSSFPVRLGFRVSNLHVVLARVRQN